jgi:septation ring formation regulator EzrA
MSDEIQSAVEPVASIQKRIRQLRNEETGHSETIDLPMSEVLRLLSEITEQFSCATQIAGDDYSEMTRRLATIESNVTHIQSDMRSLCKLVRDGNGQKSLIERMSHMETTVANQGQELTKVGDYANSIIASKYMTRSQIIAGLAGMITTALISALSLAATLMKP